MPYGLYSRTLLGLEFGVSWAGANELNFGVRGPYKTAWRTLRNTVRASTHDSHLHSAVSKPHFETVLSQVGFLNTDRT